MEQSLVSPRVKQSEELAERLRIISQALAELRSDPHLMEQVRRALSS